MKFDFCCIPYAKINSKWIEDPNISTKTVKFF